MTNYKFNLIALIVIPVGIWLGYTHRIDWWVLGFMALSNCKLTIKWTA